MSARLRFMFANTLLVPGALAVLHVAAPEKAADLVWGGAVCSSLPFGLLPAWWGSVSICSALALLEPLKWSPMAVVLILYKVIFFFTSVLPLLLAGRAAEIPVVPAIVFFSFLPVLLICTPWSHLLPVRAGPAAYARKAE